MPCRAPARPYHRSCITVAEGFNNGLTPAFPILDKQLRSIRGFRHVGDLYKPFSTSCANHFAPYIGGVCVDAVHQRLAFAAEVPVARRKAGNATPHEPGLRATRHCGPLLLRPQGSCVSMDRTRHVDRHAPRTRSVLLSGRNLFFWEVSHRSRVTDHRSLWLRPTAAPGRPRPRLRGRPCGPGVRCAWNVHPLPVLVDRAPRDLVPGQNP